MPPPEPAGADDPSAADVGRRTVEGATRWVAGWWRQGAAVAADRMQHLGAARLATRLREQDPTLLARLAEIGVVRQAWLDDPSDGPPVRAARPLDVLVRAVESRTDQGPGVMSRLGRGAVRTLTDVAVRPQTDADGQVTLCFVDLEGFTQYTALEGDEQARKLLDGYYREAGRIVRTRNGTTVKHIGDGQLLRFADPVDAVRAALDIVAATLGPLRVRAGLHRGTLLSEGGDVYGHTVNVAARVAELASGGQVMVTADVHDAVGAASGMEFGRPRRRRFKGVAERITVCEVVRAARTEG